MPTQPTYPTPPGTGSHLRVAVPLHVHKGKGADVADPSHIHSKVPKEVDNLQGSGPKPEDQKQQAEVPFTNLQGPPLTTRSRSKPPETI